MNTKIKHAADPLFPSLTSKFTFATLGMALMALGFLLALPCAKAQTAIAMADTNFIMAAAQGGMTEVKLGELAAAAGVGSAVHDHVGGGEQAHVTDPFAVARTEKQQVAGGAAAELNDLAL